MTPPANDNFDDSVPLRRWTTTIDLGNPTDTPTTDTPTTDTPTAPTTITRAPHGQGLPPGTIVDECYVISARLGAGSMGEVYAARHTGLGKRVAIKLIGHRLSRDARAIRRFITEARTLAQIQHPAIVTVEHIGELPDGRAYFVMEHLSGESLSKRLSRERLPLREALRILDQMARGLAAAHLRGVIHCDLKPDNTFLVHHAGEKPSVKLLDFGLAKHTITATPACDAFTYSGEDSDEIPDEDSDNSCMFGTPLYMSPEQTRGFHLDHRSDIYALGCVAYELVLGLRPFPQAKTTAEICTAHRHETPHLPREIWPEVPLPLDRLLFAMLSKDPAHRPTLAQVRSIVTTLRSSTSPQQDAQARSAPRLPKRHLRRLMRHALTGLAALGVMTLGGMLGAAVSSGLRAHSRKTPAPVLIERALATPAFSIGRGTPALHEQGRDSVDVSHDEGLP